MIKLLPHTALLGTTVALEPMAETHIDPLAEAAARVGSGPCGPSRFARWTPFAVRSVWRDRRRAFAWTKSKRTSTAPPCREALRRVPINRSSR